MFVFHHVLILKRKPPFIQEVQPSRTQSLSEFCMANVLLSLVLIMIPFVFVLSNSVRVMKETVVPSSAGIIDSMYFCKLEVSDINHANG